MVVTDNLDTLLERIRWRIAHHDMIVEWLDRTTPRSDYLDTRAERHRCKIDGLLEAWEELSRCKYGEPKPPPPTFE